MTSFIALAAIGVLAYGALSPEQRLKALRFVVGLLRRVIEYGRGEREQFGVILRARERYPFVTIAIVALNVLVFAGMVFGATSRSDPATLVAWGAAFGPRTTNGEWWRLLTAAFVHPSFFVLLVDAAALVQAGSILEPLVGPVAFSAAYIAAAILGSIAGVTTFPMRVMGGAAAAMFGAYGLLAVVVAAGRWRRSTASVPAIVLTRIAPGFVLFLICAVAADHGFGQFANAAAFVIGAIFGVVMVVATDAGEGFPTWRPTAGAFGGAIAAAALAAIPIRGIADVRPELRRLVAIERRTAGVYQTAAALFTKGRITAWQLADVIEQSIVPEIQAEEVRVIGLHGVPHEDEHLVADAREYLQLRTESWQLRVKGLRAQNAPVDPSGMERGSKLSFRAWAEARYQSTLRTMGKAEGAERASLQALNRLVP